MNEIQLEAADVSSLVGCCPYLRGLRLPTQAGVPAEVLGPLCSLTHLQDLSISFEALVEGLDDATVQLLTQLTALTALDTGATPFTSVAQLLALTSLGQLTKLTVNFT
jgi:hypothetical protein